MLVNFYKYSSFQSLIAPSNEVLDVLHLAVSIIWKLIFAEFESGCKNNQSDRSEEEKMCDHLITAARRRDGVLVCIFLLGQKNPIWYWMFSNFAIINKAKLFWIFFFRFPIFLREYLLSSYSFNQARQREDEQKILDQKFWFLWRPLLPFSKYKNPKITICTSKMPLLVNEYISAFDWKTFPIIWITYVFFH